MAAQAREFIFSEAELEDAATPGGGGGGYGAIDVPKDYEAILRSVEDYDKTADGKTKGLVFSYGVDGGGGNWFACGELMTDKERLEKLAKTLAVAAAELQVMGLIAEASMMRILSDQLFTMALAEDVPEAVAEASVATAGLR